MIDLYKALILVGATEENGDIIDPDWVVGIEDRATSIWGFRDEKLKISEVVSKYELNETIVSEIGAVSDDDGKAYISLKLSKVVLK